MVSTLSYGLSGDAISSHGCAHFISFLGFGFLLGVQWVMDVIVEYGYTCIILVTEYLLCIVYMQLGRE